MKNIETVDWLLVVFLAFCLGGFLGVCSGRARGLEEGLASGKIKSIAEWQAWQNAQIDKLDGVVREWRKEGK